MPDSEISAILQSLERYSGRYEREAVDAAIARREEITPYLIENLEKFPENLPKYTEDLNYYLYIYALMLLGHFREPRAHAAIVKLFGLSFPDDALFKLFGDITTVNLPIILFNTCGGSFDLIKSLVLNRQADDYVRGSAARAMVYGAAGAQLARQKALDFFSTLFTGKEADPFSSFWSLVGSCILDLQPGELAPLLKDADDRGLLDGFMFGEEDISQALNLSVDQCLETVRKEMERDSLEDIHQKISYWADSEIEGPFPDLPLNPVKTKGKLQKKKQKKAAKASRRKNRR